MFALHLKWGVKGLALALSVSTVLQFATYLALLQVKIGASIGLNRLALPLFKTCTAAVPAGLSAYGISWFGTWSDGPNLLNVMVLIGSVIVASGVFISLIWSIGVRQEINLIFKRVRSR